MLACEVGERHRRVGADWVALIVVHFDSKEVVDNGIAENDILVPRDLDCTLLGGGMVVLEDIASSVGGRMSWRCNGERERRNETEEREKIRCAMHVEDVIRY